MVTISGDRLTSLKDRYRPQKTIRPPHVKCGGRIRRCSISARADHTGVVTVRGRRLSTRSGLTGALGLDFVTTLIDFDASGFLDEDSRFGL